MYPGPIAAERGSRCAPPALGPEPVAGPAAELGGFDASRAVAIAAELAHQLAAHRASPCSEPRG